MMSLKYLLQFPISWYENNRLRTLSSTVRASSTSTSPHAVQSGNRALVRLCFFFLLVAMSMATRIFLPMYHAPNSLYCIRIEGTHLKTSSSSSVTLFLTRSHPCTHMHRLSFPILLLPPLPFSSSCSHSVVLFTCPQFFVPSASSLSQRASHLLQWWAHLHAVATVESIWPARVPVRPDSNTTVST